MPRGRKALTEQRRFGARADSLSPAALNELPHSTEAELSVLGSMIINNETIDIIVPILRHDDFASAAHAKIFEAITALHEDRRAVDLVTLRDELTRRKDFEVVGGIAYLSALIDAVPAAANAEHYAQIVREKSITRNLLMATREIAESVAQGNSQSRELLDNAQARIFQIAERGTSGTVNTLKDVMKKVFALIDQSREGMLTGLSTGYQDLDKYTSGLQNGELTIVAGRPSMGKTTFALNIIQDIGIRQHLPVVIFSLEMSKEQIARNILCCHARVDSHMLRTGRLSSDALGKLSHYVGELNEAPIYIDDSPSLNSFEIRAKVRRLKSQRDLRLVVIDYLQLMEGPPVESRQQEISAISRSLKSLAREVNVPVIAVAQLNRQAEQRDSHRPRMSDLRESGSLEQDADMVILLHRASYYREDTGGSGGGDDQQADDRSAECIIAKQRNGPTGTVNLTFLREFLRFENSTIGSF